MNDKLKRSLIVGGAVAALGAGAAVAGAAGGGEDPERPISGDALKRASKVAQDHVGGGRVTDSEVGDEEGYYEIEVRRDDGTQVDVHLDRDFHVIAASPDGRGDSGR